MNYTYIDWHLVERLWQTVSIQNPTGSRCRKTWRYHGMKTLSVLLALQNAINTLRPRQNGRHFADDIFKCIFLNENVWIPIKISLKFVPKGPINNIPSLVQIMVWRRPCDKPLSEPMMVRLLTHICVTRPQWVNVDVLYVVTTVTRYRFTTPFSFGVTTAILFPYHMERERRWPHRRKIKRHCISVTSDCGC